jgi:hypothetical protein
MMTDEPQCAKVAAVSGAAYVTVTGAVAEYVKVCAVA